MPSSRRLRSEANATGSSPCGAVSRFAGAESTRPGKKPRPASAGASSLAFIESLQAKADAEKWRAARKMRVEQRLAQSVRIQGGDAERRNGPRREESGSCARGDCFRLIGGADFGAESAQRALDRRDISRAVIDAA